MEDIENEGMKEKKLSLSYAERDKSVPFYERALFFKLLQILISSTCSAERAQALYTFFYFGKRIIDFLAFLGYLRYLSARKRINSRHLVICLFLCKKETFFLHPIPLFSISSIFHRYLSFPFISSFVSLQNTTHLTLRTFHTKRNARGHTIPDGGTVYADYISIASQFTLKEWI